MKLVTPLLKLFEVSKDEMSPFCMEFSTANKLLQALISYCPRTFSYDGKNGGVDDGGGLEEAPMLNASEHADT